MKPPPATPTPEPEIPDSLAGEDGAVVLNPSAIGNPDEVPKVWVGADLRALLNPCGCGGVNGFHRENCDRTKGVQR